MKKITIIFLFLSTMAFAQSEKSDTKVYHVEVSGVIDLGLAPYVERVIKDAIQSKADAIVFEINTFGGRLDAAVQIRDAIIVSPIKTIAFINKRAISAGALITLACQKVAIAEGGTIGAATAVDIQGQKASEKVISYFRTEMRATAEKNGRNGKVAEAMVDEEVVVEGLNEKGKLVTLTTDDAIKWKIADVKSETLDSVLVKFDLQNALIIRPRINWAEEIVRLITHPIISSILLALGILGIITEVKTPGFGIGGILAIVSLTLFFVGHYIVKLAGWEELIIFIIGLTLLIIEIFITPGFGLLGVAGIILMVGSMFFSLIGKLKTASPEDFIRAIFMVSVSLTSAIVVAGAVLKFLPKSGAWNKIILATEEKGTEGFVSSMDYSKYLGLTGVSVTVLRPAGQALIGDDRLDVVSDGEFIPSNTQIKVVKIEGNRIVVQKIVNLKS